MSETRKLAAILVSDVVGYSRLAGVDEDRILARLRTLRSDLIDPIISVHHGRIVKRTGDGAIVEFRSVVDAVNCAIEIQRAMVERNAEVAADKRIEFRVGIHLGDVVEESDGDLMGDGVNIAARLEGVCEPGAICLSEDAYRQVKGRLDLAVSDLGPTQLKNIAEPIRVYSLYVGQAAQKPTPPPASQKTGPPRLSIVVLPFANLGGGPEQEYFVDGVTESLTTDLSRIRGAIVIGRNTAFTYKGKAADLKQIGRELSVRYVLEGSVQRGGNRMRVNVQLIDAETGNHLWAERFDKPLADLFDMQDEIVSRLANRLNAELVPAEAGRAERAANPDSMDLYFQGLRLVQQGPRPPEYPRQGALLTSTALSISMRTMSMRSIGVARRVDSSLRRFCLSEDRVACVRFRRGDLDSRRSSRRRNHARPRMSLDVRRMYGQSRRPRHRRVRARAGDRPESRLRPRVDRSGEDFFRTQRGYRGARSRSAPRSAHATRLASVWMFFAGVAKAALGRDEEAVAWLRPVDRVVSPNLPVAAFLSRGRSGAAWAASRARTRGRAPASN